MTRSGVDSDQRCPLTATLALVGDSWSMLVLRNVHHGSRRFDELQRDLGIASNVLTARLRRLTEAGILEKRTYCERPPRSEYVLTDMGRELFPVVESLTQWGRKHLTCSDAALAVAGDTVVAGFGPKPIAHARRR